MNEPFETIFPTFAYFFLSPGWIIYEMDHSERFDEFNGFLTIKNWREIALTEKAVRRRENFEYSNLNF